jgi:phage terminase large subunit-like protein
MTTESCLTFAKNIVKNSPALDKRIEQLQYSLKYVNGKSISTLKMMPYKPSAMNSLKPADAIVDELALMKTGEIIDVLASGMGATVNPLLYIISTRGNNTSYFQYQYERTLEKILSGELKQDSTYIMMFEQDSEKEANQPEMWIKSNPMLGTALEVDYLLDLYEKAKQTPTSLKEFFVKNLNLWVEGKETELIEKEFLDVAFKKGDHINLTKEFFHGKEVFFGLDMSSTEDLTSLVILHYDKLGRQFYAYPFIYFPNNPIKKVRGRGIDLTQWLLDGSIQQSVHKRINYTDILEDVLYFKNNGCEIKGLGHDGRLKDEIIPALEQYNIDTEFVSQGISDITTAVKLLDKIFAQEQITCVNPAFKWQFGNIQIYKDLNFNIKMNKKLSRDSIDSCIALQNALELWRRKYEDEMYTPKYIPISMSV